MASSVARKRLINSDDVPLTVDTLKAVMPKSRKHNITKHLVEELNTLVQEPEERDVFRENLLGYSGVMKDPNISMTVYVEAVKYVSYKMMGYNNQQSWIKTFPHRHARLIKDGKDANFLRSTVACYNRNKVVNLIMEQALVPTYLLNADLFQKAINTQAKLMATAKSEKVRTDAANSLLTHLKQPETTKIKLDIGIQQDDSIRELKEATLELVRAQKLSIESGNQDAASIGKGRLIAGESRRVDD